MELTPQKATELNTSFSKTLTPVRFLGSPSTISTNGPNVMAVKSRLEIILKNLQENYTKWLTAEKRGSAICNSIEAIKARALDTQITPHNGDGDTNPSTIYPNELKPYCDKLVLIVSIFNDIATNAEQILRQLKSLSRVSGCQNEIFYRSWKIQQFIYYVENLTFGYRNELAVKRGVMRELPHCMNKAQLIRITTAWNYPQYLDDSTKLMFKFLMEEIKTDIK